MSKGPIVRKQPRARNKDGTWRKKRADAGVKREKYMTSNPRDMQFQPEAQDLLQLLGNAGFVFEGADDHHREDQLECARLIVTRWAYDFACHVWDETIGGGNPEFAIGSMTGGKQS